MASHFQKVIQILLNSSLDGRLKPFSLGTLIVIKLWEVAMSTTNRKIKIIGVISTFALLLAGGTTTAFAVSTKVVLTGASSIQIGATNALKVKVTPAAICKVSINSGSTLITSGRTSAQGIFAFNWTPKSASKFSLTATTSKSAKCRVATSAALSVTVKKIPTTVVIGPDGWPDAESWDGSDIVTAQVSPTNLGKYINNRVVNLQQYSTDLGKWVNDDTQTTDATGSVDLSFNLNGDLGDGSNVCDDANIDTYDGIDVKYRLMLVATTTATGFVSPETTITFSCDAGSSTSTLDVSAASDALDLYTDGDTVSVDVTVTTSSTSYTLTEQQCQADQVDCSDDTNWTDGTVATQDDADENGVINFQTQVPGTGSLLVRYHLVTDDTAEDLSSDPISIDVTDSTPM